MKYKPAAVESTRVFRAPRTQVGIKTRGHLPNWSGELYNNAEVQGSNVVGQDPEGK